MRRTKRWRRHRKALNSAQANMKQIEVERANVRIAETSVTQADAALAEAEAAHQTEVMRESDVEERAGRHRASAGSGHTAQNTLDYTNIYSPVDGVVSAKTVEVGQSVGKSVTVLRLTTNKHCILRPMSPSWKRRACTVICRCA